MRYGVFSALGAVALLALPAQLADADTQSGAAPAYEIEVLPGVAHSDPMNEKRWSIDAAGNATMTSGWHLNNNSIDLRGTSSSAYDDIVVAQFRVVTNPTVDEVSPGVGGVPVPRIYARVSAIHDTDDDDHELCRKARVKLYDRAIQEDGADKQIGELTYTHIDPDNNLKKGDPVPLEDGAGALQLGTIISAATDRALGANCKNYGDHLHQQANSNVAGTALWRNYDRADRRADDGMGFDPPLWGSGYTAPYPKFCADTWIFKIYPPRPPGTAASEHGPLATPVEKCAAPDNEPSSLSVSEGDGTLNLSWAAPELVSAENEQVTGYQVRSRQTPDGAWESWESTARTSYTISDLANDTTYAVQVRAVNSAAEQTVKRSGGATRTLVGAGPPATTPTEPSAPTNLTAEPRDGSIEIEWDDPDDSSISGYEYCTTTTSGADCSSWQPISDATATTTMHTISDLTNGTTYYVRIRALNSADASDPSNEDSATPTDPYAPPTSLVLARHATDGDRLDLSFTRPACPDTLEFELYRSDSAGEFSEPGAAGCAGPVATTTGLSPLAFDGLTRASGYTYRARGRGCERDDGSRTSRQSGNPLLTCGAWSDWSNAVALPLAPPPPEEPLVTIALQSPSSGTMEEGGTATFVLTRTRDTLASALLVLVDVGETRSTIAEAPSEVLMPASLRTHTFEVRTDDDGTDELASVITATVLDRGAAYDPGLEDSATVTVTDNDPATLTLQVAARVVASGRVEVALQQRGADGQWGSRILPAVRFLNTDEEIGVWVWSRPALTVSAPLTGHSAVLRITARRLADSRAEFGLQQLGADGQWGARLLPRKRFLHTDEAIVDTWYPTSEMTVETVSVGAARGQAQAEDPGDDQSMESDPGETFADPPPGDLAADQFMQPEN